ncbi:MAG: aminoacyl--tRNA ligase-related protein, partial [Patescibacteria group bacterium]
MKKPNDYVDRKTSSLLENGVFTYFRDPGVPFYLPLGRKVLTKIQDVFLEEAENLGMSHIEIPAIMRDEVLEEGEEIVYTFNERIVRLNNLRLKGYHLLTTPEPMMLDLASSSLCAYSQLPIRFVYHVDIVRGVRESKGMLKGRQFKTFMGNSFDGNRESLEESLRLFEQVSDNIFDRLGIVTHKRRNIGGVNIEHFYLGTEGDNLDMPEIDAGKRVKALSLAMAYHYNPKKIVKARFRNKQNKNSRVLYGTYGMGTQRVFYALFDSHRDKRGFNLPSELAPFQFSVIPVNLADHKEVERLYEA